MRDGVEREQRAVDGSVPHLRVCAGGVENGLALRCLRGFRCT